MLESYEAQCYSVFSTHNDLFILFKSITTINTFDHANSLIRSYVTLSAQSESVAAHNLKALLSYQLSQLWDECSNIKLLWQFCTRIKLCLPQFSELPNAHFKQRKIAKQRTSYKETSLMQPIDWPLTLKRTHCISPSFEDETQALRDSQWISHCDLTETRDENADCERKAMNVPLLSSIH